MLRASIFSQQTLVTLLKPPVFLGAILLSALSACNVTTSDKQSHAVPIIKANCQYEDIAAISGLNSANAFDNGYRLIKETHEARYYPSVTTYKYDPISSTLDVLKKPDDSAVSYTTTQYVDNNGRLTAGDHVAWSPLVNFGHTYQLGYDEDGRVVSFDRDGARSFDFYYEQGRLTHISRPGQDINRDRKEFNYDENGNLVSVYEYRIDLTFFYSCNEENHITSIHEVRDGITEGYYTLKYDDKGNLSELKSLSSTGYLFYTSTFEYEISPTPTFNLWRLRTAMGLLPSINKLIH